MYNEYPDLIYEGLISDSLYTDIIEEGLGESIKNKFGKIRTMFKTFINKVIEKWNWLISKMKQGINKIKDKIRKKKNNSGENNTNSDNKGKSTETKKQFGTLKYKFKNKDYIKDFEEEYDKALRVIKALFDGGDSNELDKFDDPEYNNFPKNMNELIDKLIDVEAYTKDELYIIESEEEMNRILNLKPEKYISIVQELSAANDSLEEFIESSFSEPSSSDGEKSQVDEITNRVMASTKQKFTTINKYLNYVTYYATLIVQQIQSFNIEGRSEK